MCETSSIRRNVHDEVPRRTADETEFLDLVDEISHEEGHALHMDFRPGDIQFVCNYTTFHSRTKYEDFEDPAEKRTPSASVVST